MANINIPFGGWGTNPATGKVERYWGNGVFTSGEDPTGGRGVNWQQTAQPQTSTAGMATQMTQQPTDFASIMKQVQQMQQQAAQPQIQYWESQKPLQETKYQNLLKDITRYSTRATASEFSRRGIPLSSGIYEQNLAQAIEPRIAAAGEQRESNLASINQQIAGLQSGALGNVPSTALQLYQLQQEQNKPMTLGEGQTLYDPRTGQAIYTAPKTYAPEKEDSFLKWLQERYKESINGSTDITNQPLPTEPKPTPPMNRYVSAMSPGGQWIWDADVNDWTPVVD